MKNSHNKNQLALNLIGSRNKTCNSLWLHRKPNFLIDQLLRANSREENSQIKNEENDLN